MKLAIFVKFDTTLKAYNIHTILKVFMELNDEALNKIIMKSDVNALFHN